MNPVLSVIIPAYKFENYIIQCVDSVLDQIVSFPIEILIRDDFSGDSTEKILKEKYSDNPKVKIFNAEENLRPYGNIKFLLERARGKYISILDGDDYLTDRLKLQAQVEFLEDHPSYVMHATGYASLLSDGTFDPPEPWFSRYPVKMLVETQDLLQKNIVSFGRTFRNIPGLMQEWMSDFELLDWAFNYEISHHGKIRCDVWKSGVYRHHESGMFSLITEGEKQGINNKCREIIKERQMIKENKKDVISIIDCFVHDITVEENLKKAIKRLKDDGHHVLLVSNTSITKDIINSVDYYFYDKRNQLFKKEYDNVSNVDFWTNHGNFTVHNLKSGLQKHGLSVLINLFNALDIAQNLGYKYFQRFETDDLYGPESMKYISSVPDLVRSEGKRGLFYLNPANSPADASFHYFFCEIEYFKSIMPRITCEEDYEKYLMDIQGNRDFRIVETYIYDHIVKNDSGMLKIKNGGHEMNSDFSDTVWNTVVSASNLHSKYKGCLSDVYRLLDQNGNLVRHCLYSTNYLDQDVSRKIVIRMTGGIVSEYNHTLSGKGSWCLNDLEGYPITMDVYQDGEIIYSHIDENSESYIQLN